MDKNLVGFSLVERRGFYHPNGCVSAGQLGDMVTSALKFARWKDLSDLLVNITDMTGFASPGFAYRRWVARRWADTAEGKLVVCIVAREEHICPKKTGLLVAAENGLKANIFADESEAIKWLDESRSSVSRI